LDENYKNVVLEGVEHIYNTFVSRVAAGRKMTFAQVDSIAQGRVWAGKDAIKIGLVDKMGGLDQAIKHAASLAKITEYKTEDYPEYNKTIQDMLRGLTGGVSMFQSREALIKEQIGEEGYQVIEQIRRAKQQRGVQALMPFELVIQ
jgi:protease-4